MEDQEPNFVGIVLSGGLHIIRNDYGGNRLIVARIGPGELFGEAFSLGKVKKLPISIMAVEMSELFLFSSKRLVQPCASVCGFHAALIRNLIHDLARKNTMLMQKIEHVTRRTTREKLLSYLSAQARQAKNRTFDIPFNRQELADYLAVDRSALSAELGRMRTEGIIAFRKNHFELR
jgi:CRP-like cAMP-binding protein